MRAANSASSSHDPVKGRGVGRNDHDGVGGDWAADIDPVCASEVCGHLDLIRGNPAAPVQENIGRHRIQAGNDCRGGLNIDVHCRGVGQAAGVGDTHDEAVQAGIAGQRQTR